MKSIFSIFFIFTLLAANQASAQTLLTKSEPRTVTDFYLLFPGEKDVYVNHLSRAEKRTRIVVEDTANGYLKLAPTADQDAECSDELAIFKKTGGGYVFAWRRAERRDGNCGGQADFYELGADRWIEVTARIFPLTWEIQRALYRNKKTAAHKNYADDDHFFVADSLPRTGRTVVTKYAEEGAGKEFELFAATWDGVRFEPNEPLPAGAKPPAAPPEKTSAAAEAAWKSFFGRVLAAVKKRDRRTLRTLMSDDFSYSCCDEPYPDKRNGAFTVWDGFDPKDYAGWKSLARTLQTEPMFETHIDDEPAREFDDARFVFRANRWQFIAYGADSM